jgi:hypothetical protein
VILHRKGASWGRSNRAEVRGGRPASVLVSCRWVPSTDHFLLANCENHRAIHGQRLYRGPTGRSEWNYPLIFPPKVFSPDLRPRIVQGNFVSGIGVGRGLFCPLPEGTGDAGQGEVAGHGQSTDCSRYDVVDMKRSLLTELRQPAVFAPIPGAQHDFVMQTR